MGGEQSAFTFALRGNGKRGVVHNLRRVVVLAIGNVGIVDGRCWRCGGCGSRGSQKAGILSKERVDAGLVVAMAVTGESGTFQQARMGRIERLRSPACQTCPIVAALQLPCSVGRGVPGED